VINGLVGPWNRVAFRQVQRRRVPEEPGIYILGARAPGSCLPSPLYNAVYVGQTTNLRNRFLQHLRRPSTEVGHAAVCFPEMDFWFVPSDHASLNRLEAMLIECLGPSANRRAGIGARVGPPIPAGAARTTEEST
jgi:hypothetical protein